MKIEISTDVQVELLAGILEEDYKQFCKLIEDNEYGEDYEYAKLYVEPMRIVLGWYSMKYPTLHPELED